MKNNEKISIVVPIYNVEEYLPRCLDSIIAQTYTNIEIMLVDDGSPDNAGAICDEYAAKDNRLRVFHIPNGGVAKARQLGVESSTGDYIVFVDPDDWLPLDSVEILYSNMSEGVDLVVASYTEYFENAKNNKILENRRYYYLEWILSMLKKPHVIQGSPWAKLYRRSVFKETSFPNMRKAQDWLMNLEISMRVSCIETIPNITYNYVRNKLGGAIYKPNLLYYEKYCEIVYNILKTNNLVGNTLHAYRQMQLSFIFECIMNGNMRDLKLSNSWLNEFYNATVNCNFSFAQKMVRYSIKYKVLKHILYLLIKSKRVLVRLFH